jgi:hypothetical protein
MPATMASWFNTNGLRAWVSTKYRHRERSAAIQGREILCVRL